MTKGTSDHPKSFGDAERYAWRWTHSDYWRTRVQSVQQIWQTVVKFIEVFRSITSADFAAEQLSNIGQKLTKQGLDPVELCRSK